MYAIPSRASDAGPDPARNPYHEPLHCGSCNAVCPELTPCTWDTTLMVGPCCTVADEGTEPDCECRFTGDMADASACGLHNPSKSHRWGIQAQADMLAESGCTQEEVDAFETFARKPIAGERGVLPEVA